MASTALSVSSATISGSATPCLPNTATTVAYFKPRTSSLSTFLVGKRISLHRTSRTRLIAANNASNGITCLASSSSAVPSALLFDCDGVLVDTEKDGHRISFNETFEEVSRYFSFAISSLFIWVYVVDH